MGGFPSWAHLSQFVLLVCLGLSLFFRHALDLFFLWLFLFFSRAPYEHASSEFYGHALPKDRTLGLTSGKAEAALQELT